MVLQIDFVIVFQVLPKIIRRSGGKVIDDGAVRRRGADLIERSCQMMMIRDIKNTAGPDDDRLFLIVPQQIFKKARLRSALNFVF